MITLYSLYHHLLLSSCDEKDSEAELLIEKASLYHQYKIDEEVLRDILEPMNNWLLKWNKNGKKRHDKNAILKKIAEKRAMDISLAKLETMPEMKPILLHSKAAAKKLEQVYPSILIIIVLFSNLFNY